MFIDTSASKAEGGSGTSEAKTEEDEEARAAGVDGNAVFNGVVTGLAITLVVMVAVLIVLVASRMGKSQSAALHPPTKTTLLFRAVPRGMV